MARSNPWPTKDFKLGQHACDLQVWVRWIPLFDLQGPAKIFASLHAAACAICHVPPIDPWQHHRRSGVLMRRMVPCRSRSDQPFGLYSRKCLNTHTPWLTDWLTDWLTNTSGQLFFTDPPKEIFVHITFNAKALERSFTTILDNGRLPVCSVCWRVRSFHLCSTCRFPRE